MKAIKYALVAVIATSFSACSDSDNIPTIISSDKQIIANGTTNGGKYAGFYVLNEGNMGSNKCTLDYYDYASATYYRNIYAENNPDVVLELGDTGNDIQIYKDRLYIVVNGSHKVEVLDAKTAKRIGQVNINSPRHIAFIDDMAYVTSSVGGGNRGTVVSFNTKTLTEDNSVVVGYNPEGITVHNGKLYIANSYNYGIGVYDYTISVVNPATMQVEYAAESATNMRSIIFDDYNYLWTNTGGNYYDIPAALACLYEKDKVYTLAGTIPMSIDAMAMYKGSIYTIGISYDENWTATGAYFKIDTDADFNNINYSAMNWNGGDVQTPYTISVNESTGEFYITDARNYTSSGFICAYNTNGELLWRANTGDIPGHIAFLPT